MSDNRLFDRLFLGAGAMKAGTTWLYRVLRTHPELHFPLVKEIHYFYHIHVDDSALRHHLRMSRARNYCNASMDHRRGNPDRVEDALRWIANFVGQPVDDHWYRALFQRPRSEMYACDFSVLSALLPADAWPQVEAKCGKLRVLYMLREPTRQLWSSVKYNLQFDGGLDMLQVWGPEEMRKYVSKPDVWDHSEFGKALRRMKAGLSSGNLKVIFFENLHADRPRALGEIEDFLGIRRREYSHDSLDPKVNESARIPMPDWFPDLFAEDMSRIREEVDAEGLELPESWRN